MKQTPSDLKIKTEILNAIEFEFGNYKIKEYQVDMQTPTYLIVENPKFKEDDGSDPNIVQEFLGVSKKELESKLNSQLEQFYYDSLPKYSDEGTIVVYVNGKNEKPSTYKWDIEVLVNDGSTHWIQEGMGFDYFFDEYFEDKDFPDPGFYVIENIVGQVVLGDGWTTDNDEDWYMSNPRKATPEEMEEYKHYFDSPYGL